MAEDRVLAQSKWPELGCLDALSPKWEGTGTHRQEETNAILLLDRNSGGLDAKDRSLNPQLYCSDSMFWP